MNYSLKIPIKKMGKNTSLPLPSPLWLLFYFVWSKIMNTCLFWPCFLPCSFAPFFLLEGPCWFCDLEGFFADLPPVGFPILLEDAWQDFTICKPTGTGGNKDKIKIQQLELIQYKPCFKKQNDGNWAQPNKPQMSLNEMKRLCIC